MRPRHDLRAQDVTLAYGDRVVVRDLDLAVVPAEVTAVVGANGSGKSTVLRALARLLSPASGQVLLDGKDLHRLPTREVARTLGLLPQSPVAPEGIAVADLVGRGRHPHQRFLAPWSAADTAAVADALDVTGTADLADRSVDELSGGQRQRVWLAMVLAQQTDILLLDEPTTFLDVAHQVEVLDLLTDLNRDRGTTVLMVLHDLNLAARYADRLVTVCDGRVHRVGTPDEVLTVETVREVFGLEAHVMPDPITGRPLVLPLGRHARLARSEQLPEIPPVTVEGRVAAQAPPST
ncbi:ABC transporter ATP-binding protein [Actinotalea sp. K2]|uniref:ABC transporter ATP-binding protein n=1 Tax=Actinotalea sp. K2 TaxID=2939438 RepID=UPI002017C787|nr:ABC transporter ATP-binding protein [Actinotalea sp. K2]MCL3861164.1 ABC transporter ATP-binding protein [Actinotalea sp. K2]